MKRALHRLAAVVFVVGLAFVPAAAASAAARHRTGRSRGLRVRELPRRLLPRRRRGRPLDAAHGRDARRALPGLRPEPRRAAAHPGGLPRRADRHPDRVGGRRERQRALLRDVVGGRLPDPPARLGEHLRAGPPGVRRDLHADQRHALLPRHRRRRVLLGHERHRLAAVLRKRLGRGAHPGITSRPRSTTRSPATAARSRRPTPAPSRSPRRATGSSTPSTRRTSSRTRT